MSLITIFTPTYNRANLLPSLYDSLKKQTNCDFEWLIVDDGSTDNTDEIINGFISEGVLSINYVKKENEGKHIAINKGLEYARGELFFIVDSDDILPQGSIEKILEKYEKVKRDKIIAGVAGRKGYITGGYIGSNVVWTEDLICSSLDLRMRRNVKGDMAEVFKTEILKEYLFPKFEGEKFCPESLIWNRISKKYSLLWFSDIVYKAEYIETGLTANIVKIRKYSPKASCLYYSELSKYEIPFVQKVKAVANYWRFSVYNNIPFTRKIKEVSKLLSIIALPISVGLIIRDKL